MHGLNNCIAVNGFLRVLVCVEAAVFVRKGPKMAANVLVTFDTFTAKQGKGRRRQQIFFLLPLTLSQPRKVSHIYG